MYFISGSMLIKTYMLRTACGHYGIQDPIICCARYTKAIRASDDKISLVHGVFHSHLNENTKVNLSIL